MMHSIDHKIQRFFPVKKLEFTVHITQPLSRVLRVLTQTAPAVNAHPTKLYVISMTTAPESQSDSLLLLCPHYV